MFEAAIIVTKKGPDYLVRLVDAHTDKVITSETVASGDFIDGFTGIQVGRKNYTPAAILTDFNDSQVTGKFAWAKDAGMVLQRLIAPGSVDKEWKNLWQSHPKLTTHLELHPDEWSQLPWELLCNPSDGESLINHPSGRTIKRRPVHKEVAIIVTKPKPGGDYLVRLVNAHTDEEITSESVPATVFANGFDDLQVEGNNYTPAALLADYNGTQVTGHFPRARDAGVVLQRLIAPGSVDTNWRTLEDAHPTLTTHLELHPDEWSQLPWELLCDPYDGQFLFNHPSGRTMGHRLPGVRHKAFGSRWPLRLLVVVGGKMEPRWEKEIQAIRQAVCNFSIRLHLDIAGPDWDSKQVVARIKGFRPHILHYIGHGTDDRGGALLLTKFVGGTPEVELWTHTEITRSLTELESDDKNCIPRVIVLNACQTAEGTPVTAGQVLKTSVASAFQRICGGAVIAMRGDIPNSAARAFSTEFYQRLADHGVEQIDRAYAAATVAIRGTTAFDDESPLWTLPRIFYAKTVDAVLPFERRLRPFRDFRLDADRFPELKELRVFVNQESLRRDLFYSAQRCSWLCENNQASPVMLVTGHSQAGKSWFLKACLYIADLEGYEIFYYNLHHKNKQDLSHFLKTLCRGPGTKDDFFGKNSLLDQDRYGDAFADFVNSVKDFEKKRKIPDDIASSDENGRKLLIRKLGDGVRKATAGNNRRKLFIVFDHLESIAEEQWQYVMQGLIVPAAQNEFGTNLRIAMAGRPDDLAKYGFAARQDLIVPEVAADHPPDQFSGIFRDYCYLRLAGMPTDQFDRLMPILEAMGNKTQSDLTTLNQSWSLTSLSLPFQLLGIKH